MHVHMCKMDRKSGVDGHNRTVSGLGKKTKGEIKEKLSFVTL